MPKNIEDGGDRRAGGFNSLDHLLIQNYNLESSNITVMPNDYKLGTCRCSPMVGGRSFKLFTVLVRVQSPVFGRQNRCSEVTKYYFLNTYMNRPRWTQEQFDEAIQAVANNDSWSNVAKSLGLGRSSNTKIKKRLQHLNLDTSHFRISGHKPKPLNNVLTNTSNLRGGHTLKLRLFREGVFEPKCYKCGITTWNDKPAPLEIEHINGIGTDNRIENLTILCPNCHAQTSTYRGKNKGKNMGV
jgi:5-methylcytosine-specific restriction endonuclease McrA